MGREVRRVPADWQHPRNEHGHYIPLFDGGDYAQTLAEWEEGAAKWAEGLRKNYITDTWTPLDGSEGATYEEWDQERPDPADYMPAWTEAEATHLMMYEDTSEGTPISPAFATAEELARWLADNNASAFADMTATYDEWLATIGRGFAISAVFDGGTLRSGVEFLA